MPSEIIVTVAKDGTTQVSVQGISGPGCTELTARLEAALGQTTGRELTAQYYEAAETEGQEVGNG